MSINRDTMTDGPQDALPCSWQINFLAPSNTAPTLTSDPDDYGRIRDSLTGRAYIDYSTNTLKYYYDGSWVSIGAGGAQVGSLDQVAANGAKIDDLGATVEIEEASDNTLLTLDKDGTGAGDVLVITNAGTGDAITVGDSGNEVLAVEDGGKLQWSANADTIVLDIPDDKGIAFGASDDVFVDFTDTGKILAFIGIADNQALHVGSSTYAMDLNLFGTGTETLTFDASATSLIFSGIDIDLADDDLIEMGTQGGTSDFYMAFDGANLNMNVGDGSGSVGIVIGSAADTNFTLTSTSGSFVWDYGADTATFDAVTVAIGDNDSVTFGDSADVDISWNSSGGLDIVPAADNTVVRLGDNTHGVDLTIYGSTTSTSTVFDASSDGILLTGISIVAGDDAKVGLGNTLAAPDVWFEWDTAGTDMLLLSATADDTVFKVGADATHGFDLLWTLATGTLNIDTSADLMYFEGADLKLNDGDVLNLGDGASATAGVGDAQLQYATTTLALTKGAGGEMTTFNLGADADAFDIKWFANSASDYVLFDNTDQVVYFEDVAVGMRDDTYINFGDGTANAGDFYLGYDGVVSGLVFYPVTTNGTVFFGSSEEGKYPDVKFLSGGTTAFAHWDTSLCTLFLEGGGSDVAYLKLNDNDKLGFGDGASATASVGDAEIYHDGTDLNIAAGASGTLTHINLGAALVDNGSAVIAQGAGSSAMGTAFVVQFDMDNTAGSGTWTNNTGLACKIVDIKVVKTDAEGGGSDTVQVFNGTDDVTATISLNSLAAGALGTWAGFSDLTKQSIANGGTLKATTVKGTDHCECEVYVTMVAMAA